jgi:hypothetical protein
MSSETASVHRITTAGNTKPSPAPATILREVCKVACFHSLQFIYRKNGMSDETQYLTLGKNVKGDEMIRGSLTKLLLGEEAFAALYDHVPTPDGAHLYLKDIFTSNVETTDTVLVRRGENKQSFNKMINDVTIANHSYHLDNSTSSIRHQRYTSQYSTLFTQKKQSVHEWGRRSRKKQGLFTVCHSFSVILVT